MTDKDEFCEQIRLCERAMYALAISVVKNDADAGEVISESIYRAYKNIDTLKKISSFKSWILRIVHNTAVEMIRKNSKVMYVDEIMDTPNEGEEDELTTKLVLREAVKKLKQPYRTTVILFYYENLSLSEIADITGAGISAVKKQLSRARGILYDTLKEDFRK